MANTPKKDNGLLMPVLLALLGAVGIFTLVMFTGIGVTAMRNQAAANVPQEPVQNADTRNVDGTNIDSAPVSDNPTVPEPDAQSTVPEDSEPEPEDDGLESAIRKIIEENYTYTDIDSITINPNLGTDTEDDYIALVYLTWNQKNKADTTQEVLSMYSEDFAARIGESEPSVSELTVFWTVPYHSETETAMKFTYERKDDGMYETDRWNSFAISGFGNSQNMEETSAPQQTDTTVTPVASSGNSPTPTSSSGGNADNFDTYDNQSQQDTTDNYVLNTSTMKIHYPSCRMVPKIAEKNYATSNKSEQELISEGYTTCGVCH